MMESFIAGLASLVLGIWIERALLANLAAKLRVKEQAFQFHALRDELQLLVAEGRIDPSSDVYEFLMQMTNFCIRNAGVLKLREVLEIAERVKSKIANNEFKRIIEDIQKQDVQVQQLAQKFFFAVANMLISNDWLVRCGVQMATAIAKGLRTVTPVVALVHRGTTAILDVVTPTKVEAVREARWYVELGNRLNPCPR